MYEVVLVDHRFADFLFRSEIENLPAVIGELLKGLEPLSESFWIGREEWIVEQEEPGFVAEELLGK